MLLPRQESARFRDKFAANAENELHFRPFVTLVWQYHMTFVILMWSYHRYLKCPLKNLTFCKARST